MKPLAVTCCGARLRRAPPSTPRTAQSLPITPKKKPPPISVRVFRMKPLAVTYSCMGNATLPSAQLRFTSEFGMGSGGTTAL